MTSLFNPESPCLGNLVLGDDIFPSFWTHYRSCLLAFVAETILIDTTEVSPGCLDVHFRSMNFIPSAVEKPTDFKAQKDLHCGDPQQGAQAVTPIWVHTIQWHVREILEQVFLPNFYPFIYVLKNLHSTMCDRISMTTRITVVNSHWVLSNAKQYYKHFPVLLTTL